MAPLVRLVLALSLLQLVAATDQGRTGDRYPPLPPKQSAYQQHVTAASAATAAIASREAVPAVLAALDQPGFRTMLRGCCPELAGLPAAALLQRLHDEVGLAEVTHNFPAT